MNSEYTQRSIHNCVCQDQLFPKCQKKYIIILLTKTGIKLILFRFPSSHWDLKGLFPWCLCFILHRSPTNVIAIKMFLIVKCLFWTFLLNSCAIFSAMQDLYFTLNKMFKFSVKMYAFYLMPYCLSKLLMTSVQKGIRNPFKLMFEHNQHKTFTGVDCCASNDDLHWHCHLRSFHYQHPWNHHWLEVQQDQSHL